MNNLQHIIENDMRTAMHIAVELCEQGDLDSVAAAFKWFMQERETATLGSGTCCLYYGEDDDGYDGWYCSECGGWFQAVRRDGHLVEPKHCQECGKAVKR